MTPFTKPFLYCIFVKFVDMLVETRMALKIHGYYIYTVITGDKLTIQWLPLPHITSVGCAHKPVPSMQNHVLCFSSRFNNLLK
jgi:hypothetical protein